MEPGREPHRNGVSSPAAPQRCQRWCLPWLALQMNVSKFGYRNRRLYSQEEIAPDCIKLLLSQILFSFLKKRDYRSRSSDRTATLWDSHTGKRLMTLRGNVKCRRDIQGYPDSSNNVPDPTSTHLEFKAPSRPGTSGTACTAQLGLKGHFTVARA